VDKLLLFLTIIPIILFLSFSTYYDNKLKNISVEYSKDHENLKAASGNVVLEQLNQTSHSNETFQKDKEAIEKQYFDLKTENEVLRQENERIHSELEALKSELNSQKAKFDKLYSMYQQVQNSLIEANEQVSGLYVKNKELCSKLKASGGSDAC